MSKVKTAKSKARPAPSAKKPLGKSAEGTRAKAAAKANKPAAKPKKPNKAVPAAKPKKPVPAAKPKKAVPAAKPKKAVPAAKPKKPVPAAKPKKAVPAAKPKKSVPAAKPKKSVPAAKPKKSVPAAKPKKSVPAAKPKKSVPAAKPKKSVPAAKPKKSVPAAKPKVTLTAVAPQTRSLPKPTTSAVKKGTESKANPAAAPAKGGKVAPAPLTKPTLTKPTKTSAKPKRGSADDEVPESGSEVRRRPRDAGDEDDEDRESEAFDEDGPTSAADRDEDEDEADSDDDDDEDGGRAARRGPRTEALPRAATPPAVSIPLPVKELPKLPSLEERAASIETRLRRQSTEFIKTYNDSFDMSWVFHDTGLEGVIYTFDELRSAFHSVDVSHLDSSVVPIFQAIKRNQEAIGFVRQMVVEQRTPITLDLVRTLYVMLHPDEGDIKTAKYRRDIPQHRLYFHEYAAPDKIALRLRTLTDWLAAPETAKSVGPLKLAAKAHYDLARIYPFPKDSGKVSRLLMNLILMRGGFPPAIMHHSERQRYYDALKAPSATALVQMVRDSVENSISSIEKLLDEHESKTRAFIS